VKPPSVGGAGRTFVPGGTAPAWKVWLLPSDRRLSPARFGNECCICSTHAVVRIRGEVWVGDARLDERHEDVVGARRQLAALVKSGSEVRLKSARFGICWRSTWAVPRSSSGEKSARS
jgi:hypothetical protein